MSVLEKLEAGARAVDALVGKAADILSGRAAAAKQYREHTWRVARGEHPDEPPAVEVLQANFMDAADFARDVATARARLRAVADLAKADELEKALPSEPERPNLGWPLAKLLDANATLGDLIEALQASQSGAVATRAQLAWQA